MQRKGVEGTVKHRTWCKIGIIIACLLVTVVQAAKPTRVSADGIATLRPIPEAPTLDVGEHATMEVTIEDVSNLFGFQMMIEFDPALLAVQDADTSSEEVQIELGDFVSPDWILKNEVDVENGVIQLAVCIRAPSHPAGGNGVLATVTWQGLAAGTSEIILSDVLLSTPRGESIPVRTEAAQVTICRRKQAVPTPMAATEQAAEADNESLDNAEPDATPTEHYEQPSPQDGEDGDSEDVADQSPPPTDSQDAPDEADAPSPRTPEPTEPDKGMTDLKSDDRASQQEAPRQDGETPEGMTEQEEGEAEANDDSSTGVSDDLPERSTPTSSSLYPQASLGDDSDAEGDDVGTPASPQEEELNDQLTRNEGLLVILSALIAGAGIVMIGRAAARLQGSQTKE